VVGCCLLLLLLKQGERMRVEWCVCVGGGAVGGWIVRHDGEVR
jgi:hypothetical protein